MRAFTTKELADRIAKLLVEKAVFQALGESAPQVTMICQQDARKGVAPDGSPWVPSQKPRRWGRGGLLNDTGKLIDSIEAKPEDLTTLAIGSDEKQAGLQQYGGTIRPVNATFLAIPLTEEAARAESPRNFPGELVACISQSGRGGVLVPVEGGEPVYALTKGPVTIPARPFLGFSEESVEVVMNAVGDKVSNLIIDSVS